MKILFLIDPNSIHDIKWAKYFSMQSDFECYFICRKHHYSKHIVEEVKSDFGLTFLGTVDYFSTIRPIATLRQFFFLHNILKQYQIKLFHIQYAEPNALWVLIKYIINIKVIITSRGTDVLKTIPSHFAKNDLLNQIVKSFYLIAFKKADWITVTSQKQWDSIKRFSGRKNKYSIIRTGVEIDELSKDTTQFFRNEITKPFILFPRYIKPLYNHEFCLSAIKELPPTIKKKYQMIFVGKNGGDLNYQKQLIELMINMPDVEFVFLPKLDQLELWELYKRTDLVVMTPVSDGSPVSGMEALSLNKKLILGPIEYDENIFKNDNTYKIKEWDNIALTKLMENALKNQRVDIFSKNFLDEIDYKENMKKLSTIYYELIIS